MQKIPTLSLLCIQVIARSNTDFRLRNQTRIASLPEEVQVDIWTHLCHHKLVSDEWISIFLPIIATQTEIKLAQCASADLTGEALRMLVPVCAPQLTALDLCGCTTFKSGDFFVLQGARVLGLFLFLWPFCSGRVISCWDSKFIRNRDTKIVKIHALALNFCIWADRRPLRAGSDFSYDWFDPLGIHNFVH